MRGILICILSGPMDDGYSDSSNIDTVLSEPRGPSCGVYLKCV